MLHNKQQASVADRIRTSTDAEMASIIAEYCTGVITEILKDTGYTLKADDAKYAKIVQMQLQAPTTERPRVLDIEEVKMLRGQMVYIHYIGPCHGFYHDEYMPFFGDEEIGITRINNEYSRLRMPMNLYNKSWIALAYKPNETLCVLD